MKDIITETDGVKMHKCVLCEA